MFREALQVLVEREVGVEPVAQPGLRHKQVEHDPWVGAQLAEPAEVLLDADGFAGLEAVLQVGVDQLEANPVSQSRRGVVAEDLKAVGADRDAEVLLHAQALLEAIQRQAPEAAAIGVDLKDIEGASLAIRRVTAAGTGVKVEEGAFRGDITIEDVHAGPQGGTRPNP